MTRNDESRERCLKMDKNQEVSKLLLDGDHHIGETRVFLIICIIQIQRNRAWTEGVPFSMLNLIVFEQYRR